MAEVGELAEGGAGTAVGHEPRVAARRRQQRLAEEFCYLVV